VRSYVDQYESGDLVAMDRTYADLRRFERYCNTTAWRNPRWQKMALKVLKLPGGSGGLRPPFLMPADEELSTFADGLFELGIPELTDLLESASA
jgi:hypothetical protein